MVEDLFISFVIESIIALGLLWTKSLFESRYYNPILVNLCLVNETTQNCSVYIVVKTFDDVKMMMTIMFHSQRKSNVNLSWI